MDLDLATIKMLLGGSAKVESILSDDELTDFLDDCDDNIYRAANRAALAIAAYYTHKASQSVGPLTIQNTARANAFRELAVEFGKMADNYIDSIGNSEFVFIDKDEPADDANDEAVFKQGLFDF